MIASSDTQSTTEHFQLDIWPWPTSIHLEHFCLASHVSQTTSILFKQPFDICRKFRVEFTRVDARTQRNPGSSVPLCTVDILTFIALREILAHTHTVNSTKFRTLNMHFKQNTVSWPECLSAPSLHLYLVGCQ